MEWLTYSDASEKLGVSVRTLKRWAKEPEAHGLAVRRVDRRVELAVIPANDDTAGDDTTADIIDMPVPEPESSCMPDSEPDTDIESYPVKYQFEYWLHKKLLGKTGSNRRQCASYYRKIYRKTGVIPESLKAVDGRTAPLRGQKTTALAPEIEKRLIEMIHEAALSDPSDPKFITQRLRKITNIRRRLEHEFGQKIPEAALYRAKDRNGLQWLLDKPDYDDEVEKEITYFNPVEVFELVQVDGMTMKYIELRDSKGAYRQPIVIEFFDTGSRYMVAMDVYFSESSENSIDIFSKFLTATPFPKKVIRIRPDNAGGFRNLRRPIHHLNFEYSMPDGFCLQEDFARSRAPKQKVHLETSHRRLHDFEDWITYRLPQDRILERRKAVKFIGGKQVAATVTRFDMDLEEFRRTGLIEQYRLDHNGRTHRFSEAGKLSCWVPGEKFRTWLDSQQVIHFTEDDTRIFRAYGYEKRGYTIQKNGSLTCAGQSWKVVEGMEKFRGRKTRVKVSEVDGKLYLFEDKDDGLLIGEAMPVGASVTPKFVERRAERRQQLNEFEMICVHMERNGLAINNDRLMQLYRDDGLTMDATREIIESNKARYSNHQGYIAFNLFITDFSKYRQAGNDTVKPYARLGLGG